MIVQNNLESVGNVLRGQMRLLSLMHSRHQPDMFYVKSVEDNIEQLRKIADAMKISVLSEDRNFKDIWEYQI